MEGSLGFIKLHIDGIMGCLNNLESYLFDFGFMLLKLLNI